MQHIQGLRFVAMSWIIVFHYLANEDDTMAHTMIHHRPLDLFTVISGFATHLAYGSPNRDLGSPIQFLTRRCAKLLFMYYLTLSISFFLKLISLGVPSMAEVGREYLAFLFGLLGLNAWVCPALVVASNTNVDLDYGFWTKKEMCWPHNGPLWYIQALVFCWLTYPLLRNVVCGPNSIFTSRTAKVLQIVAWWLISMAPFCLVAGLGLLDDWWLFIKTLPVFMLAPFYVGVVACDLYKQETADDAENREGLRAWGQLVGEVVFAAWFMLPLVPYANVVANVVPHSWCILFGAVLFCFGCEQALRWTVDPDGAGDERQPYHYHIGVMWLLESEFVVMLGDVSLCGYTLQMPVAKLYLWILHARVEEMPRNWMAWYEFGPYIVMLYVVAFYLSKWVDKAASAWLSQTLAHVYLPDPIHHKH